MLKNKYPGLFIAIEGLDGSGLSTQSRELKDYLKKQGLPIFLTKEPTDNIIGGLIRGVLSNVSHLPHAALQLLFAADRNHHLEREIIPILSSGGIVVCDRYVWSSVAFGSVDLDKGWLLDTNKLAVKPDISILISVSPKICMQRIEKDRFEFELYEKEQQLKRVWKNYQWLVDKFEKDFYIVDGKGSVEEVLSGVISALRQNSKAKRILKWQ